MVDVNFDRLKEEGFVIRKYIYTDLDEALLAYKELHESLIVAEQVLHGEEGESFTFNMQITSTSPYTITTQIDLI